ncbi:NMCC_0638 family (lipo)protein [Stenotrophomonas rhizophila]
MRHLSWALACLLLSPLAAAQPAQPASPATQADTFNQLFGTTCMTHLNSVDGLTAWMAARNLAPLDDTVAQSFLHGTPGRAWAITLDGDQYAVSRTDAGLCAVYARRMDGEQLQSRFAALVSKAPAPMTARQTPSPASSTATRRSVSYLWSWPDETTSGLLFTLTTSSDPDAPLQAMMSLARTRLDDDAAAKAAPPSAR